MKLSNKFRKALVIGMAMSTALGTTVYASPTQPIEISAEETAKEPKMTGTHLVGVQLGETFDALAGVKAFDKDGNDISHKIQVVVSSVDTTKAGDYQVIYQVADAYKNVTVVRRDIMVIDSKNPHPRAPQFEGIEDTTIGLGVIVDFMEGVTAKDSKGNDLTAQVESVEIHTTYKEVVVAEYKVTDANGITTTKFRFLTLVEEKITTWDPAATYVKGDRVMFEGVEYEAQWWTKGDQPGQTQVWRVVDDSKIQNYEEGGVYFAGDLVRYEGKIYEAKWWTNSVPGSDDSWALRATEY